jgi:hypothetical protein
VDPNILNVTDYFGIVQGCDPSGVNEKCGQFSALIFFSILDSTMTLLFHKNYTGPIVFTYTQNTLTHMSCGVARTVVTSPRYSVKLSFYFNKQHCIGPGARGSVVGCGTMLQVGRSRVRVPMRWILFN